MRLGEAALTEPKGSRPLGTKIGSGPGDENELRIKLRTQVVGAIHLIFKLIFANKMRDLEATALQNDPA